MAKTKQAVKIDVPVEEQALKPKPLGLKIKYKPIPRFRGCTKC